MFFQKRHCKDCEPAQAIHFVRRAEAIASRLTEPLNYATVVFSRGMPALLSRFLFESIPLMFMNVSVALSIGEMKKASSKGDNERTKCLWEEASRRGIVMEEFCVSEKIRGLFIARFNREKIFFHGLPRPKGEESESLSWMDNKRIMREKFSAARIPMAKGGVCRTWEQAEKLFSVLRRPVIAKPHLGSRSRHTTVHVETIDDFRRAFLRAKKLSPWVIIEEELSGMVFRVMVVGGRVVAVMRREPPHVIADGSASVEELVKKENARTERHGPIFHEITLGEEAHDELKRQSFSLSSVPRKGTMVTLNQKISRSLGASTSDVTDFIHSDNKELFERVGAVLDDAIVGIDFIIEDINISWRNQKHCGVIECNSLPFIDLHHFPLNGKARNVAGAIWDIIFPASKADQKPIPAGSA